MKLYRIYTEAKNVADVLIAAGNAFDAFTVLEGEGYWRGNPEATLILEFLTENGPAVYGLAEWVKKHNSQEAVLVVSSEVDSDLV